MRCKLFFILFFLSFFFGAEFIYFCFVSTFFFAAIKNELPLFFPTSSRNFFLPLSEKRNFHLEIFFRYLFPYHTPRMEYSAKSAAERRQNKAWRRSQQTQKNYVLLIFPYFHSSLLFNLRAFSLSGFSSEHKSQHENTLITFALIHGYIFKVLAHQFSLLLI